MQARRAGVRTYSHGGPGDQQEQQTGPQQIHATLCVGSDYPVNSVILIQSRVMHAAAIMLGATEPRAGAAPRNCVRRREAAQLGWAGPNNPCYRVTTTCRPARQPETSLAGRRDTRVSQPLLSRVTKKCRLSSCLSILVAQA